MTVYDANVKIGCLVNPEPLRTPSGRVAAATGPVECATTRMVLPLPGEGADDTPMACPVCSQPFTIRRSSPARASRVVQRVFLAVAAAGLLLAAAGTVLSFPRSAEYAFAAVGFLGLVAAMLCPTLPPTLHRGHLVTLRDDPTPFPAPPPGQSGSGGHKILDVRIAERSDAEEL